MPFEIPDAPDFPPGTYKAQLAGVQVKDGGTFKGPNNPTGAYRVWDWLIEKDGELQPLSVTSSINTGPRSTSYAWLTALLGRAPQAGEKIEDPTGKTVVLQIGKKENGYPKVEAVLPFVEPQQALPGVPR